MLQSEDISICAIKTFLRVVHNIDLWSPLNNLPIIYLP